jgi:hypothetical protein
MPALTLNRPALLLAEADVIVIGAPHSEYRDLKLRQPVLDPSNHLGRGGLLTPPS